MKDNFFAVFNKGGAVKYSIEKSSDDKIRVTTYYPSASPENIEYNRTSGKFTGYEGHDRKGGKRDDALKDEFLRILNLFLDKKSPIRIESKGGKEILPSDMRQEIEWIVERLAR